jgi:hypothetical protein
VTRVNNKEVDFARRPFSVIAEEVNSVEIDGEGFDEAGAEGTSGREMLFSFGHPGVFVQQLASWTGERTLRARFYISSEVPNNTLLTLNLIDVKTGRVCGSLAQVLKGGAARSGAARAAAGAEEAVTGAHDREAGDGPVKENE